MRLLYNICKLSIYSTHNTILWIKGWLHGKEEIPCAWETGWQRTVHTLFRPSINASELQKLPHVHTNGGASIIKIFDVYLY